MNLDDVIERLSIHDVSLQHSICGRSESWLPGAVGADSLAYRIGQGAQTPYNTFSLSVNPEGEVTIYRFCMQFACRVFEQSVLDKHDDDTNPEDIDALCEITAVFDVDYVVDGQSDPEDDFDVDALESFAKHNVPYHVWPFFREHLHSMLSKMQVPPIAIPTLRVPSSNRPKTK